MENLELRSNPIIRKADKADIWDNGQKGQALEQCTGFETFKGIGQVIIDSLKEAVLLFFVFFDKQLMP